VSFAIDINVLVYASDSSSAGHAGARRLLEQHARGSEILYLPWIVAVGYLRIVTNAAILTRPLKPAEAEQNLNVLLRRPTVRALSEAEGFWDVYREVSNQSPARGARVTDVHIAALLKQHGVRVLYTNDTDFLRFSFLEVRNPLASA
jgi:uncharacterized protein